MVLAAAKAEIAIAKFQIKKGTVGRSPSRKENKTMTATQERISKLHDELVPLSGKAETIAGEIIRAISRIGYRNFNDGDHLGVGYGRETCNPAGRYLDQKCSPEVGSAVFAIWGIEHDEQYDKGLEVLEQAVLDYLDAHPELFRQTNNEDMWDYRDSDEDVGDDDYDDEEY